MERREFLAGLWLTTATSTDGARATSDQAAEPLYLLIYDHGGIILWGVQRFSKYLRNAIEWLERYPGFKIGLDNEAYTYDYLAEHEPQLLEELRGYLARYAGRFGIGTCTYGQPLMHFLNEESNVRQIAYALEANRRHLNCVPAVYLMSEHAMHSQMPQILAGFGFKGAIMRTHFMMYGYNPTFDAAIGWWVGLDGSRIPAIPTYRGQGAEFGTTTVDNWILTRCPGPQCKESFEEFKAKFAHIKPLLATCADDSHHRREELVRMHEGKAGYRWVLLEEVFPKFPAPVQELKTGPNDFHVRMPWGYCGNEVWNQSRRAEVAVLTAERLAALELLLGGADHEEALRQAWKNLLVAQHHDVQIVGLLKDARKFLPASISASNRVSEASMGYLASRMKGGSLAQVTVFNPHSWPRKEWIEASISLPRGAAQTLQTRHGGKAVPSVLLSARKHSDGSIETARLAILAEVPAMGLTSYSLAPPGQAPPSPAGIEIDDSNLRVSTAHWKVRLNAEGGIDSLEDRRTGKAFLKSGRRSGFFAGKIEGRDCESKGKWSLTPGPPGAPWMIAREEGSIGGIPYTQELTLRAESRRLDWRVTFHIENQRIGVLSENKRDNKSAFVHEEKLRFKLFPAVGEEAVGIRDLPFAVAETHERYVEGNYWTALSDGRVGIAVFNVGTMGSVREADGGLSIPLAHAMYYVWGTRMLDGDFTYEFALYPFAGEWSRANLHRRALDYNFPCVAIGTPPGDGRLGHRVQVLDATSPAVIVSAFYPAGGRTYVRLYEYQGRPTRLALRYLKGRARLTEVDLAGNARGPLASSLSFRPWQIRTVRVEPLS